MSMLKNIFAMTLALVASLSAHADVTESPERLKRVDVYFDEANAVAMTITITRSVDTCNQHGMVGSLTPIGDANASYFLADLLIMSTKRACFGGGMVERAFSKVFVVNGNQLTVLVPDDARVEAIALH